MIYLSKHVSIGRDCVKNIIYTTARSNNMNGCGEGGYYVTYYAWWEVFIVWMDIVVGAAIVVWGVFAIRGAIKDEKKQIQ